MKKNNVILLITGIAATFFMYATLKKDIPAYTGVPVHIFTEYHNEPEAIALTCLKNLCIHDPKQRPQHLLISYELLTKIKALHYNALAFFKEKGINNPLEQIIITTNRANKSDPHYVPHHHDHNVTSIVRYYEDAVDLAKKRVQLTKNNCNTYIKGTTQDYTFVDQFKKLLGLSNNWKWYDTNLGVYYVTRADSNQIPFNVKNFTPINPLEAPDKKNSTEWTDKLDTIFNTQPETALRWSFYLMGHGYEEIMKKQIFGLPYDAAMKLLSFLNTKITTDIVTLLSCYTPAQRVYKLAEKYNILPLNFTLISAVTEFKQQYSTGLDLFYYEPAWFTGSTTLCLTQTYNGPGLDDRLTHLHESIVNDYRNNNTRCRNTTEFIENHSWNPRLQPSFIARGDSQQLALTISKGSQATA